MLTEIDVEALLADEVLADQVWVTFGKTTKSEIVGCYIVAKSIMVTSRLGLHWHDL